MWPPSLELLKHVQSYPLLSAAYVFPHSWPPDSGPCVVIIRIFVFPPLPVWEHFSFSASLGQGAGSQLALMCFEGHGVWEEEHGVNTACGPVHEPNKSSRPSVHSLPFCINCAKKY